MNRVRFSAFTLVRLLLVARNDVTPPPQTHTITPATNPNPIFVDGNKTCQDLLGSDYLEFKIEPVTSGVYTNGYLTINLTVNSTSSGQAFDVTSNRTVDPVFAKGGPQGNLNDYSPAGTNQVRHRAARAGQFER